jgi:amino acid transporter
MPSVNSDSPDSTVSLDYTVVTSHADIERVYPEGLGYRLKRLILGKPYVTEQLHGERLNKTLALGVLSSDCISSSAYGAEQILTQLTPAIGLAAFSLVTPIMFVILGVLLLVTMSYLDVIKHYTSAGGAYMVARSNFGPRVAQVAAVALLIDYTVTVAVQCSAGTLALASAFPQLSGAVVEITVGVVLVLFVGNLRGIREAGAYFAFPTYFFIAMLGATIGVGFFRHFAGTLKMLPQPPLGALVEGRLGHSGSGLLMGLAFLTLLRAYASGGSSLTGLEAISNGVASFRKPESQNARVTLIVMSCVLAFLLLGTTLLAKWTHALPYGSGTPTVVSQEVQAVFGTSGVGHVIFLIVQIATVLILYTGGNTSFNGFPYLANYVATDGYLPRQLTKRGHRLAFSNGIIVLTVVALILIIGFQANVTGLISLYAIGVFTGFSMAGSGLVVRHLRERGDHWKRGVAVNAISAVVTGIVVIVFLVAKFTEGAWIIAVIGPIMFVMLLRFKRRYVAEDRTFVAEASAVGPTVRTNQIVVFIDQLDAAAERALEYCQTLPIAHIRAVHFDIDPVISAQLVEAWGRPNVAVRGVSLEVVECEDRRLDRAALAFVTDLCRDLETFCMVIFPRRGIESRLARFVHDRTADSMAKAVAHVPRTATAIVPFWPLVDAVEEGGTSETQPDVVRGAVREVAHLDADEELDARAAGTVGIGTLKMRQRATIAGRVRSITVGHEGSGRETRCVVADATGSITVVFLGRPHVPGIERGTRLLLSGVVGLQRGEAVILNPDYEIVVPSPEPI